jgi:hypothetical protein
MLDAECLFLPRETLEDPASLRENEPVIAGQGWVDGWQATRLLGLRADHGQEAGQAGEVFSAMEAYALYT